MLPDRKLTVAAVADNELVRTSQHRASAFDDRLAQAIDAAQVRIRIGNFAALNFDWSGFGERISRTVEISTARAMKRADEAVRRAERHAERQARRWGRGGSPGPWDFGNKGAPAPPGASRSEPVAEEERMAILKMLQEKKITAEQAEQLLQALEGGR